MKKNQEESVHTSKAKMIFICLFFVLAFVGGCGYYLLSNNYIQLTYANQVEYKYVDLGEFKVNLKDTDKKRYFSGKIFVGYDKKNSDCEKALTKDQKLPVVDDVINSYFREKTYDYLSNSDNTEKIKKDIIEEINKQLDTCKIEDIRFSQYLLQ